MKCLSNSEFEILMLFFDHDNKILEKEANDLVKGIFDTKRDKRLASKRLNRMVKKGAVRKEYIDGNNYYVSVTKEEYDAFLKKEIYNVSEFSPDNLSNKIRRFFGLAIIDEAYALKEIEKVLLKYNK